MYKRKYKKRVYCLLESRSTIGRYVEKDGRSGEQKIIFCDDRSQGKEQQKHVGLPVKNEEKPGKFEGRGRSKGVRE